MVFKNVERKETRLKFLTSLLLHVSKISQGYFATFFFGTFAMLTPTGMKRTTDEPPKFVVEYQPHSTNWLKYALTTGGRSDVPTKSNWCH